jgi:ATP-dependent HslUV protease subunit HslV
MKKKKKKSWVCAFDVRFRGGKDNSVVGIDARGGGSEAGLVAKELQLHLYYYYYLYLFRFWLFFFCCPIFSVSVSHMNFVARRLLSSAASAPSLHSLHSATSPLVLHGTTILCVRRGSEVAMIGDGQVSRGSVVVKSRARKIRLMSDGKVVVGVAGVTSDAVTMLESLEKALESNGGQLLKACVQLGREWRTGKSVQKDAAMLVADKEVSLYVSGSGDVMDSDDGLMEIGSGGSYAIAAAKALVDLDHPSLTAEDIARRSMKIASQMCVYTNENVICEVVRG